jgi:alpha-L-fucosidase 2
LALWARLGRADKVSDLLRLVFRPAETGAAPFAGGLYPNLFAAHPPFQIDGNLGFTAVLAEALLQSHDGSITLLPALPTELRSGSVTGFVARPGVLVDIEWVDGALRSATLRARGAPVQARIRYAGRTTHRLIDASGIRLSTTDFDESDTA